MHAGKRREMRFALAECSALYAKGLVEIEGDIPGRRIFFGKVDEPLPEIAEPEFNFRSCRLLAWAVMQIKDKIDGFLARHGRDRVAVVLGDTVVIVTDQHPLLDLAGIFE